METRSVASLDRTAQATMASDPSRPSDDMSESASSLNADHNPHTPRPQSSAATSTEPSYGHPRRKRFSFLRFRHASDPQLSQTAKEHGGAPPMPTAPTPSIITTAPTADNIENAKRMTTPKMRHPFARDQARHPLLNADSIEGPRRPLHAGPTFRDPRSTAAPPPYGDESSSALALPVSQVSESERSDGSSNDHRIFATTTTTHTVSTTTTFFRLARRKKDKGPLFPLPPKVRSDLSSPLNPAYPRPSTASSIARHERSQFGDNAGVRSTTRSGQTSPSRLGVSGQSELAGSTSQDSLRIDASSAIGHNSHADNRQSAPSLRYTRKGAEHESLPNPTLPPSTRTSISTTGRPSLGGLFQFSRLRQNSEFAFPRGSRSSLPGTPASLDSKHPSSDHRRELPVVLPAREEGDTPARYLARLESVVNRSALVSLLTKSDDDLIKNVLRSYMRRFSFFEDPLDIAVRKLLMQVELPKETQQIDRTLQSFADRYHECNPGIFVSPDDAYFVAFSILILHTDVFNKNNKHKMQKPDYVKNSKEQSGIAPEILEYFYDNIAYTPFIHVEDDMDVTSDHLASSRSPIKRSAKNPNAPALKKNNSMPVDPYALIFESKVEVLRPVLDETLTAEDPFSCWGPSGPLNIKDVHQSFFRAGVIQILSARSRPDAFLNQATITNPAVAQIGVVDLRVSKVGLLWRKDAKKKKTRSPWQEWGAILTSSQLYLFRNSNWVKGLIHQFDSHRKAGRPDSPVVFKPPLEQFKPDFLIPTDNVVALVDSQYKKHKNAFVLARQSVYQEVFLADSEGDLNEWLGKLNYAAAFRTAGVRMKSLSSTLPDASKSQDAQATEPRPKVPITDETSTASDILAGQVLQARKQIMKQKIKEADEKISTSDKQLDEQLRTSRHLGVLAPIQPRTRQHVVTTAEGLATKIRWSRIEKWRIKCHRDILSLDLDEDASLNSKRGSAGEIPQKKDVGWHSKSPFSRFNSKASSSGGGGNPRARPNTQPTGTKLFSMDELFRSPSKVKPQSHKPKGSWEIPPLNFDLRRSSSLPRDVGDLTNRILEGHDAASLNEGMANVGDHQERTTDGIPKLMDSDERHLLVDARVFESKSSSSAPLKDDVGSAGLEGNSTGADAEDKEGLAKVRLSLQKRLQNAHVPNPHRGRKTKDMSTKMEADENGSTKTNERLTRSENGFTLHGKKASVIKFGTEWQAISNEEMARRKAGPISQPNESQKDVEDAPTSEAGAPALSEETPSPSTASFRNNSEVSAGRSASTSRSVDFEPTLEGAIATALVETPPE